MSSNMTSLSWPSSSWPSSWHAPSMSFQLPELTSTTVSYLFWYTLYFTLLLLFYIFSSPFRGNRELRTGWTGYVYASTILYVWLGIALAIHLPIMSYDVNEPISMLSPLFLSSALTLIACECVIKALNRFFVFHVGFSTNSVEVIQNSALISTSCCLVYSQCGMSTSQSLAAMQLSALSAPSNINSVCAVVFKGAYTNAASQNMPTVLVLWSTAMSMVVLNYALERLSTYRGLFSENKLSADDLRSLAKTQSSSVVEQSHEQQPRAYIDSVTESQQTSLLQPLMLDMVPWYAIMTSYTLVDLLIHLKLFLGRFDMRTLQSAMPNSHHYTPPVHTSNTHSLVHENARYRSSQWSAHSIASILSEQPMRNIPPPPSPSPLSSPSPTDHVHYHHLDAPFYYDHLRDHGELWFDWMSDCGDGFNSSYAVARALAQPKLRVNVKRRSSRALAQLQLPRAKVLFLGGDLAYPSPNQYNYENRFFIPFQCALPPPRSYSADAISLQKPAVASLRGYNGPECYAIPGNHDWFDGLQTYLRYICARDWLGGWLLPQEKSWFAVRLCQSWWIFGLDNALSDDIDINQFQYFARIAQTMTADDRVILMYHEPDWIINAHEGVNIGTNIYYLQTLLAGRVVLKLAGDIHNYTRHMPVTSPSSSGSSTNENVCEAKFHVADENGWSFSGLSSWIVSMFSESSEPSGYSVYMEDLLKDIAPQIALERTQSAPLNPLHTTEHTRHAGNGVSPNVHRRSLVAKKPVKRSRQYSLVNSPPPSPMHSNLASPMRMPRPMHRVTLSPPMPQPLVAPITRTNAGDIVDMSHVELKEHTIERTRADSDDDRNAHATAEANKVLSSHSCTHSVSRIPIKDWSVNDVCAWLSSIGLGELTGAFRSNGVNGRLLSALDENDLRTDLNVHSGLKRKKLLIEIDAIADHTNSEKGDDSDGPAEDLPPLDTINSDEEKDINRSDGYEGDDDTVNVAHMTAAPALTLSDDIDESALILNPAADNKAGISIASTAHISHVHTAAADVRPPPILLVSGGGGAFMHPTHVPHPGPIDVRGQLYNRVSSYPSLSTSRNYALLNIFGFRKRNWRFDVMGGAVYFLLIYSLLPVCQLNSILHAPTWTECFTAFVGHIIVLHVQMLEQTYLSLATFIIAYISAFQLTPHIWPLWKRFLVGTIHTFAHSISAFSMLILMETLIELGIYRQVLGQPHLHNSPHIISLFSSQFPFIPQVIAWFDQYTMNMMSVAVNALSYLIDTPEAMAELKQQMCSVWGASYVQMTAPLAASILNVNTTAPFDAASVHTVTRLSIISYYISHGLYLWVLCTSSVSFIFGTYLWLSTTYLNCHATEAFSSLRVEGYKNFIRFHISRSGDLEVFVLGIDRCARSWRVDQRWSGWTVDGQKASHEWSHPSSLCPDEDEPDSVRLVDYTIIRKTHIKPAVQPVQLAQRKQAEKTSKHIYEKL